jgi:hypothetical protein
LKNPFIIVPDLTCLDRSLLLLLDLKHNVKIKRSAPVKKCPGRVRIGQGSMGTPPPAGFLLSVIDHWDTFMIFQRDATDDETS